MNQCPKCASIIDWCEQVDCEKGEVTGYWCTKCGYEEEFEK
ncbi:MAG: hypothetical protein ACRCSG_07695 [Cellulosilyticaceae bacterium]